MELFAIRNRIICHTEWNYLPYGMELFVIDIDLLRWTLRDIDLICWDGTLRDIDLIYWDGTLRDINLIYWDGTLRDIDFSD